jgi:hypothetical protein
MSGLISIDVECPACDGTGLYSGMGERDGAAVVCSRCSGTGMVTLSGRRFVHRRRVKPDVRRVFHHNPGIQIGEGNGLRLEDFGGMPVEECVLICLIFIHKKIFVWLEI